MTKIIKKLQSVFFTILGRLFVYPFSNIVKRDNHIWVFGSNFGYADNPKYLYEEVHMNYPSIKTIWIYKKRSDNDWYKSRGINAFYYKSLKGIKYCLKAGVYIYSFKTSDINYYTSGNVFKVNLWHGIGMKECEFRIKKGRLADRYNGSLISRFRFPVIYQKPDLLLNVGKKYFEIQRDSFKVDENTCVVDIFPRCKPFFDNKQQQVNRIENEEKELHDLYMTIKRYNKVYFYMPTFRDSHRDIFTACGFDFIALNNSLKKSNDIFVIKVHPNTFSLLSKIDSFSNIIIIKHQFDIYPILPFIDTLITDYSSIYFDCLLLRKELVLFPFDIEEYKNGDRELSIDYNADIKGTRIYKFKELLDIVDKRTDCHLQKIEYDNLTFDFWGEEHHDIAKEIMRRIRIHDMR